MINFWFYYEPMSSDDCADETRANLEFSYELESVVEIDRWGAYPGAGYAGIALIEGGRYEIILFCSTEHETPFEIMMVCDADAYRKIGPGFQHIEDSFELAVEPEAAGSSDDAV